MLHIALCDDNPASIEILEKYFDILNDSTIDYDVYFSAEELYRYKLNNELTYDIYILDIEMQGMNGLELAKTIRTNEPNALIIFLTSYSGLRHLREIKITINRRNAGFFMSNFIYFYVVRSCILSLYVI